MGLLIEKEDFTGKYELPQSIEDKINAYIDFYEEDILIKLLGNTLFQLLKANIEANKTDATVLIEDRFKELIDPISFEYGTLDFKSKGLKMSLLAIIYFHYVRETKYKVGMTGAVVNQTETATEANPSFLILKYNEGIKNLNTIYAYCTSNLTVYPQFKGRTFKLTGLI